MNCLAEIDNCIHQGKCSDDCPYYAKRDHDTNSENCWCSPEVVEFENGNKLIIHNENQ